MSTYTDLTLLDKIYTAELMIINRRGCDMVAEKLLLKIQKLSAEDLASLICKLDTLSKKSAGIQSPKVKTPKSEEQKEIENVEELELPRKIQKLFVSLIKHEKKIQEELNEYEFDLLDKTEVKNLKEYNLYYPLIAAKIFVLSKIIKEFGFSSKLKATVEKLLMMEAFVLYQTLIKIASLSESAEHLKKSVQALNIKIDNCNQLRGFMVKVPNSENVLAAHDNMVAQHKKNLEAVQAESVKADEAFNDSLTQAASLNLFVANEVMKALELKRKFSEDQFDVLSTNRSKPIALDRAAEATDTSPRVAEPSSPTKGGLLRQLSKIKLFYLNTPPGLDRTATPPVSALSPTGGNSSQVISPKRATSSTMVSPKAMPRFNTSLYHSRSSSAGASSQVSSASADELSFSSSNPNMTPPTFSPKAGRPQEASRSSSVAGTHASLFSGEDITFSSTPTPPVEELRKKTEGHLKP